MACRLAPKPSDESMGAHASSWCALAHSEHCSQRPERLTWDEPTQQIPETSIQVRDMSVVDLPMPVTAYNLEVRVLCPSSLTVQNLDKSVSFCQNSCK